MYSFRRAVPITYGPATDLIAISDEPVDDAELDALSRWLWTVGGETQTVKGWAPYDTRIRLVDDGLGSHRDYLVQTENPEAESERGSMERTSTMVEIQPNETRTKYQVVIMLPTGPDTYISSTPIATFYEQPVLPRPGDQVVVFPPNEDEAVAVVEFVVFQYFGYNEQERALEFRRPMIEVQIFCGRDDDDGEE